ncbi:uncharacterized protein P174DRAFT_71659 [Aspergillus novofumigatus IBT 16806]|uniref:Uncharacterized protein n=1 Tax=Aspergillus novofumigatus (strain IBT 16806) TaxID=1392255 RepID=A0A2I1BT27_ASPN1|nr:uncharacterized protein P174DRAFT_71659 [Aspergillus novofumigatus IBT 16806]PKX88567.1 hypothetical protein P174DRAFT_71659 [Aspergillus novofumigatus IBT 16806]
MCRVTSLLDVHYNYSPQIYRSTGSTLAARLRRPNGRPSWPRSSKLPRRTSWKMLTRACHRQPGLDLICSKMELGSDVRSSVYVATRLALRNAESIRLQHPQG